MVDEEDITRMRSSKVSNNNEPRWIQCVASSPFRLLISKFPSSSVDIVRALGCARKASILWYAEPLGGRGKTLPWSYMRVEEENFSGRSRLSYGRRFDPRLESVSELDGHPRCCMGGLLYSKRPRYDANHCEDSLRTEEVCRKMYALRRFAYERVENREPCPRVALF